MIAGNIIRDGGLRPGKNHGYAGDDQSGQGALPFQSCAHDDRREHDAECSRAIGDRNEAPGLGGVAGAQPSLREDAD